MTLDFYGRVALLVFLCTLWEAWMSLRISELERVTSFLLTHSTTI